MIQKKNLPLQTIQQGRQITELSWHKNVRGISAVGLSQKRLKHIAVIMVVHYIHRNICAYGFQERKVEILLEGVEFIKQQKYFFLDLYPCAVDKIAYGGRGLYDSTRLKFLHGKEYGTARKPKTDTECIDRWNPVAQRELSTLYLIFNKMDNGFKFWISFHKLVCKGIKKIRPVQTSAHKRLFL